MKNCIRFLLLCNIPPKFSSFIHLILFLMKLVRWVVLAQGFSCSFCETFSKAAVCEDLSGTERARGTGRGRREGRGQGEGDAHIWEMEATVCCHLLWCGYHLGVVQGSLYEGLVLGQCCWVVVEPSG